jgi:2-polyprenyl-6-methoxyphenol hydroxylase-like FAD-dependent oxidoreductase
MSQTLETTCCIAGGGPAGVMLGYLLARGGVNVTVLEKHEDFFRDFRGDTVHPSTLEVLYDLDLLDEFLKLPHERITSASARIGDSLIQGPDFQHVPTHCKFVALMPQWEFLNFLSSQGKTHSSFDLRMQHEAVDLLREGDRIAGVVVRRPGQPDLHVRADLVVGCDGRHSVIRTAAQLELVEFGVPIDVLWFRISRKPNDPSQVLGNVNYGKMLILINRSEYFQAGMIIRKGSFDAIKEHGLDAFKTSIVQIAPYLADRVDELREWDQIKILTVQLNRLRRWYRQGLLCIGDAAHAMSPVGGVGINLAIQDAVAAANFLTDPLLRRSDTERVLAKIQRRRELPTRITQRFQAFVHRGFVRFSATPGPVKIGGLWKTVFRVPAVNRTLGFAVGVGARPEHPRLGVHKRKRPVLALAIGVAVGAAVTVMFLRKIMRTRARPVALAA